MLLAEKIRPVELRTDFKSDISLVLKILELSSASYVSNAKLLEREMKHNRDIYIITNENDDLLAFFMVNYELVDGRESWYLGLSACRDDLKGNGLGKSLYRKFMEDCREREKRENKRFLLWWTTATPIVYYWFNKHVSQVQPDMNGDYTEEGKNIVLSIIREKYPEIGVDKQHPFVLRSVAEKTNYSLKEQARLQAATQTLGVDVFRKFNMREENEDRFLMIGYAPD